jgi:hypothetical protein
MDSLKLKNNWENNMDNWPLNYKYKIIFKSKRNGEKLIDGWDVKIEGENWEIHSPWGDIHFKFWVEILFIIYIP